MATYEKQGFIDGQTLSAANLILMEEAIIEAQEASPGSGGVGIESVEQTTTSTVSGGVNVVTVTLTDGTESEISIRNGAAGEPGSGGGSIDPDEVINLHVWKVADFSLVYTDRTNVTISTKGTSTTASYSKVNTSTSVNVAGGVVSLVNPASTMPGNLGTEVFIEGTDDKIYWVPSGATYSAKQNTYNGSVLGYVYQVSVAQEVTAGDGASYVAAEDPDAYYGYTYLGKLGDAFASGSGMTEEEIKAYIDSVILGGES